MRRAIFTFIVASLVTTSIASAGRTPLSTELVSNIGGSPTLLTHAPGDPDRLFILQRDGMIRIILNGELLTAPFLDLEDFVSTTFEGGLLGLAFHPDYQRNGKFYVDYTGPGMGGFSLITHVVEFQVCADDPNAADPASARTIITVGQPASNHNAGWIGFSPNDGYLYIPLGDGGFGSALAQDITDQYLGKLLRLDVNGDDFPEDDERNYAIPPDNPFVGITGDDEIWAVGLRNPWRASFDRETGDLWIGDVGAGSREEVDFQPADDPGGANYGWGCMEGSLCAGSACTCGAPELVLPVHEYSHAFGCAITGGTVYRGCAIPDLQGTYFFGDYCTSTIWSFRYTGTTMFEFENRTAELDPDVGSINNPSCFGEDAYGELYIVTLSGSVYKIVPEDEPSDLDGDGVPDTCDVDLPGDLDNDGDVDFEDLLALLDAWGECPPNVHCPADLNRSGDVGFADLLVLLDNWS